jgi:hypothetical protein
MAALGLLSSACGTKGGGSAVIDFQMGDKAPNPPLTYTVVETSWASQLGEGFKLRSPQNRFLVVTLSVTNGGGMDVTLPLFSIEDSGGRSFLETESGEGIDNWFGFLRSLTPAQTQQGKLVFDVPLASYKLKLPNGGDPGEEKWVNIALPLRMDTNISVQGPELGGGLK